MIGGAITVSRFVLNPLLQTPHIMSMNTAPTNSQPMSMNTAHTNSQPMSMNTAPTNSQPMSMNTAPTSNQTFAIKAIYANDQTFLFTDDHSYVWFLGTGKLGYVWSLGKNAPKVMTKPVRTAIRLEEGECIVKAHRTVHVFAIYTSSKRLFFARTLKPSISGDTSLADREGMYEGLNIQAACNKRSGLRSTAFVSEPAFAEPILGVDEVMFSDHTVFFRCGTDHCVYRTYLEIWDTANSFLDIIFKPVLHCGVLVYYKFSVKFIPDVIEYRNGFVYMRAGSIHYALYPSGWASFQMDGITSDCIHLLDETLSVITSDGSLYHHYRTTETMEDTGFKGARILETDNGRLQTAYIDKKGQLACNAYHIPKGNANDLIAAGFYGRPAFLMTDTQAPYMMRTDILCISVRNLVWYRIMSGFVLTYNKDNQFHFYAADKVRDPHMEKLTGVPYSTYSYSIYRCEGYSESPATTHAGRDTALFHAGDRCFAYHFSNREPGLCTEIVLEADINTK